MFNLFSTAVSRVAEIFSLADRAIMDKIAQLQLNREKWGKQEKTRPEQGGGQTLWKMLYADDAGIVSWSLGRQKMVTVAVTASATFGFTVPVVKTEHTSKRRAQERRRSLSLQSSLQSSRNTNKHRVCVLRWGYQRRQRLQWRDRGASAKGLGMLPAE